MDLTCHLRLCAAASLDQPSGGRDVPKGSDSSAPRRRVPMWERPADGGLFNPRAFEESRIAFCRTQSTFRGKDFVLTWAEGRQWRSIDPLRLSAQGPAR